MSFASFWAMVTQWIELHPNLPLWIQSVGSILAIAAVFWISNWQTRRASNDRRRARAEYLFAIVGMAIQARSFSQAVLDGVTSIDGSKYIGRDYSEEDLNDLMAVLSSVKLVDFPSAKGMAAVAGIVRSLMRIRDAMRENKQVLEPSHISDHALAVLSDSHRRIEGGVRQLQGELLELRRR